MNNKLQNVCFISICVFFVTAAPGYKCEAAEYRVVSTSVVASEPACMPAVTKAPNGDILVAFSTQWEPYPWGGVVKLVVSKDKGKTWSKPRVLLKDKDPRVTYQVANGLQTLSNGDILLPVTYCLVPKYKDLDPNERRPYHIFNIKDPGYRRQVRLLRSKDNGKTWTVEAPPNLPEPWCQFGRLLETRDGRLIMPGDSWYLESTDFGKTWGPKVSLGVPIECETNICEAVDGTFVAIIRQQHGLGPRRMFITTFSNDGGKSWTPWQLTNVQGKMPDVLLLPSGRVLLAVGAEGLTDGAFVFRNKERYSFDTLFISDDNGKTWKKDIAFAQVERGSTIVPADSPCMVALDDGKVLVVMQAMDRAKEDQPLRGYSVGMSVIANVIEPVKGNLKKI